MSDEPPDPLTTRFLADVMRNPAVAAILARWPQLELPNGWLVAGCLFQTVWNLQAGRPPTEGIADHDLFYFDGDDLSAEGEQARQQAAEAVLADLGLRLDVANQARVHLWYPQHFGRPYAPLDSVEAGMARFLVLETCVGVRPGQVCAPYGLEGLYAGRLTANPLVPFAELFERKVASYRRRWPSLRVGAAEGTPQPGQDGPAGR